MMAEIYSGMWNMCLTTGIFILLVALCRCLFRRAPHRVFVFLWILAGLRLLVPVTIESPLSVRGYLEEKIPLAAAGERHADVLSVTGSSAVPPAGNPADGAGEHAGVPSAGERGGGRFSGNRSKDELTGRYYADGFWPAAEAGLSAKAKEKGLPRTGIFLSAVWLSGALAVLICGVVRYVVLRLRLRDAVLLAGDVWQSDRTESPFLLGIIRPRIYVPFSLGEKLPYVLLHERTHRRNGDHIIKACWYVVCAVYWFHPLVWLAFVLLGRDMELACDERATAALASEERSGYARALFEISVGKRPFGLCPLAFGEVGVKMRIKHILKDKKPAVCAAVVCAAVCLCFGVVLFTEPKRLDAKGESGTSVNPGDDANPGGGANPGDDRNPGGGVNPGDDRDPGDDRNPGGETNSKAGANADGVESTQEPDNAAAMVGVNRVDVVYFGDSYQVDLDGDGRAETVKAGFYSPQSAQSRPQGEDFVWNGVLSVEVQDNTGHVAAGSFGADMYGREPEGAVVWSSGTGLSTDGALGYLTEPQMDRYYFIDLDPSDAYVEIGFYEMGPSGDPCTYLVRYADGELVGIGSFTASPEDGATQFPGDGTVQAVTRCDVIQTDWIIGTWHVADGKLVRSQPKEGKFLSCETRYEGENPITAKRDFTAFLQDPLSSALAYVPQGTKLAVESFMKSGDDYIINFYYDDEEGKRIDACFRVEGVFGKVNLVRESVDSADEILDGLSYAG